MILGSQSYSAFYKRSVKWGRAQAGKVKLKSTFCNRGLTGQTRPNKFVFGVKSMPTLRVCVKFCELNLSPKSVKSRLINLHSATLTKRVG